MCIPCLSTVDESARGIVQTMGKFSNIAEPGLSWICVPFQTLNAVSIQVRQENFSTDTKTSDNVTVRVITSVQFSVEPEKVNDFYFKLSNPVQQIEAQVDNIVRGHIPTMDLDKVYSSKEELAEQIKKELSGNLTQYGVEVHSCLMTDISPDQNVMRAMNEINAAKRNREANVQKAEADKLTAVKQAEARADAELLDADADAKTAIRKAEADATAQICIAEGNAKAAIQLAEAEAEVRRLTGVAVQQMKEASGLSGEEVVHLMLAKRYIDALKQFGASGKSSIVVPSGASAITDLESQVRARSLACSVQSQSNRAVLLLHLPTTGRPP